MVGFPCKSISGQNNWQASFLDKSSTTGGGFASLVQYVDRNLDSVKMVICENVQALSNQRKKFGNECPIKLQTSAFEKRGFVGWSKVLDATKFGLAQSRNRTWAVYIRKDLIRRFCSQLPLLVG